MSAAPKVSSFVSTGRVVIPKNPFRIADEQGHLPQSVIPKYNKFVHPIYPYPNATQRTVLCITEKNPILLNGNPVLPALVQHPETGNQTLIESQIQFGTVKGISNWVLSWKKHGTRVVNHVSFLPDNVKPETKPSKLSTNSPEAKHLDRFFQESKEITVSALENELQKLIIASRNAALVYLDQIFLYLFQRPNLTQLEFTTLLHTMGKYVGKDIIDTTTLNMLILQALVSANKVLDVEVGSVMASFREFLLNCSDKLRLDVITEFDDQLLNTCLEFCIRHEDLAIAEHTLEIFSSRRVMPSVSASEAFLNLLSKQTQKIENGEIQAVERKDKLLSLNYLSPVLHHKLTEKMVHYVLPYCVHQAEIFSLLDLILKSKDADKILQSCINELVLKLGQLKSSQVDNSLNISSLYQRLTSQMIEKPLSESQVLAFIVALVTNSNFRAIRTILNEQPWPDIKTVLEIVTNQTSYVAQFGFTQFDKEALVQFLETELQ